MKGRVLLINPHPEKVSQTTYHSMPVLGIGYLAAAVLKEGYDCKVIDGKMEALSHEQIIESVSGFKPDVIGISSMTHDMQRAHELALSSKKILPGVKILLGGPHATSLPHETLEEFSGFDILVMGEGEYSIIEVLHSINIDPKNQDFSNIKGVAFRNQDQIYINPKRDFILDLDSINLPAWRLFPKTNRYAVYTSRGCPFNCNFCVRILGNKVRYRSPENVIEELKLVVSLGGEYVFFRDETFLANKKHFLKICELMKTNGLNKKLKWGCTTHCSTVTSDALKTIKEAGCNMVEFGIESGNDEILKRMGKKLSKDTARKAIKLAKDTGLDTFGNFIFGHPFETKETIQQTIDFAVELNTTAVSFGAMVPYPGTKIYEMVKKGEGGYNTMSHDWSHFDKYQGGAISLEGVSKEDIAKAQVRAFATFYFKNLRLMSAWNFFIENRKNILFYLMKIIKNKFCR